MRRLICLLALGMSAFAATLPRKAPEFVIRTPEGKQELLSAYRGKTVVFAFMFTTCSHCQHTAQVLAQVQKEYAAKGVQILGATFNTEAPFQVQQFNKAFGVNFPCGFTTEKEVRSFIQQPPDQPPFVPALVFIDKTGTIRSQYIGDETFLGKQETNIRTEIEKTMRAK